MLNGFNFFPQFVVWNDFKCEHLTTMTQLIWNALRSSLLGVGTEVFILFKQYL